SAIDAAREMACASEPPLTFQAARKASASNQIQPRNAQARIGISATLMDQASSAPTTRGPRMLAKVSTQITPALAKTLAGGWTIEGQNSANAPTAAIAIAVVLVQLA